MALVFRPRRGMKSTMAGDKASLVLESGELFLEYPDTGVGTGASRFKIGDGTTEYSNLPYATPFIFTIQKNGSAVNPNVNGVVNLTIGTADVTGLQSALDGKLSTTGTAAAATKWTTARNINGLSVDGTANRVNFGTCSTAAGTAAKTVDCAGFALVTGAEITVKFTVTNSAANPTLNVNNTGAKAIQYRGAAISADVLAANRVYTFRYDGTNYVLVGDLDSNTSYSLGSFGITATAAELNTLDGITATTAELNKMHGVTASTAELNYVDGVTSNIQTQLNGKAASNHSHAFSAITGTLDASKLSGTIDIARLPAASLERCVVVADDDARFALTTSDIQLGDTVKVTETNMMYMVVDTAELDNAAGYEAYTASVAWSNITGKPSTFTPSTHTHNYAGSTSAGGAANTAVKLQTARAITLAGDVTGTANFDGSEGVTITATVKDDSHNHVISNVDGLQDALDEKLSSTGTAAAATKLATARLINGLSFDGTANRVNYGTCSTAAGTAAKTVSCTGFTLITGSEITVKFTVTNTAANPTLNVNGTGAKAIYYRGAAISAGYLAANRTYTFRYNGTQYDLVGDIDTNSTYTLESLGVTATAAELNKLDGATVTVTEINYLDGVTSAIQTQLNSKAASNHSHTTSQVSGLGAAATKAVTDSTSAAAIGTGANLVTERDVYYGLPKINNSHAYTSNTGIFAPTAGGTSGQVLRSNGSTATPTWANAADLISTLDCGDEG